VEVRERAITPISSKNMRKNDIGGIAVSVELPRLAVDVPRHLVAPKLRPNMHPLVPVPDAVAMNMMGVFVRDKKVELNLKKQAV